VGRGDALEEKAVFWRAAALAVAAGLVLAMLAPLVSTVGKWFVGAEPRVLETMDGYVRIRLYGAPFALVNYALLGYVLGRGEGRLALGLQVVLNGTNIGLSILLGLQLGWGVPGVAWGTVGGELTALVVGLAVVVRRLTTEPRPALSRVFDLGAFGAMIVLNRDIMIRSFALLAAFSLFTRQGAAFGTATLAANAVLMNFFMVAGFFLDGFAAAAEQLAGRAVGARYAPAFRRAVALTALWGFVLAGSITLAFIFGGNRLIAILTTSPEVRSVAAGYLPWAALIALSGVLAFQMDGVFIGSTWSRDMRNMMLLSFVIFCAALVVLVPAFGNHGLWAALHLFLLVRGISLAALLPARLRTEFPATRAA
jgi:putative MATE family efflux protein